jgi:hypothetical protein
LGINPLDRPEMVEFLKTMMEDEIQRVGCRERYQMRKKNGWIDSNQRRLVTRVWLASKPPKKYANGFLGDRGDPVTLAYQEIVKKIESEGKDVEGDKDTVSPRTPKI